LTNFIVDLKRELSSFAWMLHKIQMTRKSPYGAFCVKLNCMELMKRGSDFLRQVVASISCHWEVHMKMECVNMQIIIIFLNEFRLA